MNWFRKISQVMWDKESAEEYLSFITPILDRAGYTGRIVGSVNEYGMSEKDLDILLIPKIPDEFNFEIIMQEIPGDFYSGNEVYYTYLSDGRLVDFFFEEG